MKVLTTVLAHMVVWISGIRFYKTTDECPNDIQPFREAAFIQTLEEDHHPEMEIHFKFYRVTKDYYTHSFGRIVKKTHTLYMVCCEGNDIAYDHYPHFMSLRVLSTKVSKILSDEAISNVLMKVYVSIMRHLKQTQE